MKIDIKMKKIGESSEESSGPILGGVSPPGKVGESALVIWHAELMLPHMIFVMANKPIQLVWKDK